MVVNIQGTQLQYATTILEQLNLSKDQIEQLTKYLKDEAGDEVLSNLTYQDLSKLEPKLSKSISDKLKQNINYNDSIRLVNILFAIGGATCVNLVPMSMVLADAVRKGLFDEAKWIALEAARCGKSQISTSFPDSLISGVSDAEVLKKAVAQQMHQTIDAELLLLTAYFIKKYPTFTEIETADRELIERYERIVMEEMEQFLGELMMSSSEIKQVMEAIENHTVDDNILNIVGKKRKPSGFFHLFLSGCAYLNYAFSEKLTDVVTICLVTDTRKILDSLAAIGKSVPSGRGLMQNGGNLDKVFHLDAVNYIKWAARSEQEAILLEQYEKDEQRFLAIMADMGFAQQNVMLRVVKKKNSAYYEEYVKKLSNVEQDNIINSITNTLQVCADEVREYLRGNAEVSTLYPFEQQLKTLRIYNTKVRSYVELYHDYIFQVRFMILKVLTGEPYAIRWEFENDDYVPVAEKLESLFMDFDDENLDLPHQLYALELISNMYWSEDIINRIQEIGIKIFSKYLAERRQACIEAFAGASAYGRVLGLYVLEKDAAANKQEILAYAQDSSKSVKEELLRICCANPSWEAEIKALLDSKKQAERELAVKVLVQWDENKYKEDLKNAFQKEKSAKIKALLEKALSIESDADVSSSDDLVKELHKGGKKRTLAWAYETPFSIVHKKDGTEADEEYLQAILLCYTQADGSWVSKNAALLAKNLNAAELALYVNELFDKWLEKGAESKKKWVLYAAAIHGGTDIIQKIQHQLNEWPKAARGAIAAEAVQALALSPLPQALLIVDGISRKFKFKQVKAAAGKALDFAAAQLRITTEELADKIVPDIGFDENMQREFDYGERKFTVKITVALEIEVFDENGKKLKNLPAPGKKDDAEKAAAAYEEFKQMKKQMKATVNSQKMRLELALSSERLWRVEAWKDLFVKNPIMHQFAIGLIWGIYEDHVLIQSFRYMEDGSFNTEDEDEYTLPDDGKIGLVHPIELSEESLGKWKEQLEDYEITQPFEQLYREIACVTEEEKESKHLERFGGCLVNDLSLGGKLQSLGWYRGSVQDAGGFYTYYREDSALGLGVELYFSGSFVGGGYDGDVTVYDARFYKAGTVRRGSYMYDEVEEEDAYYLKDVPPRYFSEVVLQLQKATASSKERDENWKSHQ